MVFCNPDLLWRAEFERPRLGQGAFKEAFQAVFKVCFVLSSFSDSDRTALLLGRRE